MELDCFIKNVNDYVNTTSAQHNTHVKMQDYTTSLQVLSRFYY